MRSDHSDTHQLISRERLLPAIPSLHFLRPPYAGGMNAHSKDDPGHYRGHRPWPALLLLFIGHPGLSTRIPTPRCPLLVHSRVLILEHDMYRLMARDRRAMQQERLTRHARVRRQIQVHMAVMATVLSHHLHSERLAFHGFSRAPVSISPGADKTERDSFPKGA